MSENIEIATIGRLGIIALDRPRAINALDARMIAAIRDALTEWAGDDRITAVLFEGRGARGFCAGGDVRAIRELVLAGRDAEARGFFAAEYRMNAQIAAYPKPTIALGHGAIMGGGIGIFGHCRYRLATSEARFAMPEGAIGFIADVGVNALLAKAPLHWALAFLLTGLSVGVADAIALRLCDMAVTAEGVPGLKQRLTDMAAAPGGRFATLLGELGPGAGNGQLCTQADAVADVFSLPDAADIVSAFVERARGESAVQPWAEALTARSPTSLAAILQSHLAARQGASLQQVLAADYHLASLMISRPDFIEGVRAVLVDKDRRPRWSPDSFPEVQVGAIAAALRAAKRDEQLPA